MTTDYYHMTMPKKPTPDEFAEMALFLECSLVQARRENMATAKAMLPKILDAILLLRDISYFEVA